MDKLSELIKVRLDTHSLGESAKSAEVLFGANEFLKVQFGGEEVGVKAYRLERGALYIASENSVWSQEFLGRRAKLLKYLQEKYGKKRVQSVRIKCLTIK